MCFNTQPPGGSCYSPKFEISGLILFQHTVARRRLLRWTHALIAYSSFNTQSREGGCRLNKKLNHSIGGFNTQSREGGCVPNMDTKYNEGEFQHTVARRRLPFSGVVGTLVCTGFNTQSRGGGCAYRSIGFLYNSLFQHTAARRRLHIYHSCIYYL